MRYLVLLLLFFSTPLALSAPRPNVLFIAIDDLKPTLGVYGDEIAQTPEIDSLASRGITFLNHHVQVAVCGASRAALTTSLMAEETGVDGFDAIRGILPKVITLPQHFRNNGYETAATGKFHDYRTVGTVRKDGTIASDGYRVDDPASWSIPYARAADGFRPPSGKPAVYAMSEIRGSGEEIEDHGDHKVMTKARNLMDRLSAGNKPFFLAVGFYKPHLPFIAPQSYWDWYVRKDFPIPRYTGDPANASSQLRKKLQNIKELSAIPAL